MTDRIETFTATGVRLASGEELRPTSSSPRLACGCRRSARSTSTSTAARDLSEKVAFRGMMLDGVPNLAFLIGYTNASWTLKVGLVCEHFCRLLAHMDAVGADTCVAELPYPHMPTRPLLELSSGYVQRSLDELPRQGLQPPWDLPMSFRTDARVLQ